MGMVSKMKTGRASNSGAPKKPSIPAAKSVKASSKRSGTAGVKG